MKEAKVRKRVAVVLTVLFFLRGSMGFAKAVEASCDVLYGYQGGMAVFEKEGKQGAVNLRQEVVIPPLYDFISLFEYGLARVLIDEKWGIIRDSGERVLEPEYDYISSFPSVYGKSVASIFKDGKMGFVDSTGHIMCEPRFDEDLAGAWYPLFHGKEICVRENGLWGLLGIDGRMIAETKYADLHDLPWSTGITEDGYTFVTNTDVTGGLTPYDVTAADFPLKGDTLEERIASLSAIYQNTKWYRIDASDGHWEEITDLSDLTIYPHFRKGVVYHDYDVRDAPGGPYLANPFYLIYMNAYGDLLRVVYDGMYEEAAPSGEFYPWDIWDMKW